MLKAIQKGLSTIRGRVTAIFAICLLPLLGFQLVIQSWGTNVISKRVYESAYANVAYLSSHFSDSIFSMRATLDYLLQVNTIREFFVYRETYSTADYYEKAKEVSDFLYRMAQSNPFIHEIQLSFPRSGVMLSSREPRHSRLSESALSTIREVTARQQPSRSMIYESGGEYRIFACLGSSQTTLPGIFIEILLDQQVMVKQLSTYMADHEQLSLQYNHDTQTALFSNGDHLYGEEIAHIAAVLRQENAQPYSNGLFIGDDQYILVAVYAPEMHSSFAQLIPIWEIEFIPTMLRYSMVLFAGIFALLTYVLFLLIRRQISRPTLQLIRALDNTSEGRFETRVEDGVGGWPSEYQQLASHFNSMNEHNQKLITQNFEKQIKLEKTQLKQLQAQINPHFLYNSFFLLRNVIRTEDFEQADSLLECLGSYFRYITDNRNDMARLEDEYRHTTNYLSVQLMRFEERLDLQLQPLPDHLCDVQVPRLLLQPILENVLVHGRWYEGDVRRIRLTMRENAGILSITISDNGRGVDENTVANVARSLTDDVPLSFTSGIINIHHRLKLMDSRCGLQVALSPLGGFEVTVHLKAKR